MASALLIHGVMRVTLAMVGLLSWAIQPNIAVPRDPYQPATLCTSYPINTGRHVTVSNGEELQKALDTAAAGDEIALAAGAVFRAPARRRLTARNRPVA